MVVKLAPWACSLYENKTIACNPPYIEIIKQPAVCTAKYESAAVFTGCPFPSAALSTILIRIIMLLSLAKKHVVDYLCHDLLPLLRMR